MPTVLSAALQMDLWLPRPPGAWELQLSNLIFSGLTWAFIPAAPCLCAGWSGATNLYWLTYTVWKGSLGPPVSSASSLLPSSLSPGNRGLLWSSHMSRAMVNWCALLINWIPALSSQPLGAVKDCLCIWKGLVSIPGRQSCGRGTLLGSELARSGGDPV